MKTVTSCDRTIISELHSWRYMKRDVQIRVYLNLERVVPARFNTRLIVKICRHKTNRHTKSNHRHYFILSDVKPV
jgi:hypothetical protein